MKINTLLPWFVLALALSGCLPKASTKTESLIGSFSLQAPKENLPPDFSDVDLKYYVRFKGTCLNLVDSFQVQFVTDMNSDGTQEYTSWNTIPSTAPVDPRSAGIQTSYPLNTSDYDVDCSADGSYDFWFFISQMESWLGVAPGANIPVNMINIRGMFGSIPTEILYVPTNGDNSQIEANTFQFHAGHTPVGVGLCQELSVYLAHISGGVFNYNVKNSSLKNFTSTFDTGLDLGTGTGAEITIYNSTNCMAGTEMQSFNFSIPANITHKKFSYKMNYVVSTMRNITLTTTSFGTSQTQALGFQSATASSAEKLFAGSGKMKLMGGACESVHVLAADIASVATNIFDYSPVNVFVSLSDTSKFEFRTSCDSGTVISGSTVTLTYTNGEVHQYPIYIKAKAGTSLSDSAVLNFTQSASEFQSLPTVYINPPELVDHMSLERVDGLSFLFNHECYPFQVSLRDSLNSLLSPVGLPIEYRIYSSENVSLHDDPYCENAPIGSNRMLSGSQNQEILYWTRRQFSVMTGPLASTSSAYIQIDGWSISPYVKNPQSNINIMNLNVNQSLLDILGRGRQEIMLWQFGSMGPPSGMGIYDFTQITNHLVSHSTTQKMSGGGEMPVRAVVEDMTSESGGSRYIRRQVYDYNTFADASNGVRWYSYTGDTFLKNWQFSLNGQAAIIGAYINFSALPSQQHIIGNISAQSGSYYLHAGPSGEIGLTYYNSAPVSTHCVTASNVLQVNKWASVVLKLYREADTLRCAVYVNGIKKTSVGDQDLPVNLSAFMDVQYSSTTPLWTLNGKMTDMFIDVDKSTLGVSRYSDSNIQSLHSNYFEKRYYLYPSP